MRTVFGKMAIPSPRLVYCDCQPHESKSFSPLAQLLPERTTPGMLFLETQWSAWMSYGVTADLLQQVLPMDSPLHASTIREQVFRVAERMEEELGEEPWSFIEGCERDGNQLPPPDGPLTVGIDGGLRAWPEQGTIRSDRGPKPAGLPAGSWRSGGTFPPMLGFCADLR